MTDKFMLQRHVRVTQMLPVALQLNKTTSLNVGSAGSILRTCVTISTKNGFVAASNDAAETIPGPS